MQKLSGLFYGFLKIAAGSQRLGLGMIRVAILVIFVWIGGLKFWNYEAEGIVPFVANSPFMSFFYNEKAPDYKQYKMPEGSSNPDKHEWHVKNNTYGFSHGLGILIMSIGILTFFGFFSARVGLVGELLAIVMTLGTLVQRADSRVAGIVEGDMNNPTMPRMVNIPKTADVDEGDIIVTSGFGGVYPKGLMVGTVSEMRNDEGGLLKIAVLEPAVDFQKLEDVMVITASREAPPEPLKTPPQTPGTETDPAAQAAEQAAAANGDEDSSDSSSSDGSSSSDSSADSGEGSAQ